jgi:tetratricopeptide (TPR) repeat protein
MRIDINPPKHSPKIIHIQQTASHSLHHSKNKKHNLKLKLWLPSLIFLCFCFWGIWKYSIYYTKKNDEKNYIQGMKSLTDGNFSDAEKNLEKFIKNGNETSDALLNLGISKYNQKDYTGAIETYSKVLEKDPTNTIASNSLGNVYRDQKNFEKAQEQYEKTIQLTPSFSPAYANLSIMLLDLDRKKEALETIQRGLEKIPDSMELQNIQSLLKPEKN